VAPPLVVCHACHRHVRSDASACPFCASELQPRVNGSGRAHPWPALAVLAFAAAGCAYGPPPEDPEDGGVDDAAADTQGLDRVGTDAVPGD